VEKEKLLIEILKIKLLFFLTFTSGSFGIFMNSKTFINGFIFSLLTLIGVFGVLKNLKELGNLYKEIKDNK